MQPTPFLIPTSEESVYEMEVDNTSKELFETCARAAEYYTVHRRTSKGEKPALNFGGVIHSALVPRKLWQIGQVEYQHWVTKLIEAEQLASSRPKKILELNEYKTSWQHAQESTILSFYNDKPTPLDEWRTADRALDAIKAYNEAYPVDKEPFKIIPGTVELPFRIKLGEADLNSWVTTHAGTFYVKKVIIYWTGKIDCIVDYGSYLIDDHKTTSIIGANFYDDFVLSSQMHGYTWAGRKLGYPVAGLLLDVLALRKPTRTGTPTEFQRQRFFYTEQHIAEWERDTFTLITDFLEHLCRSYFPKSPKWCFGKYGRCQYWDVCTQIPEQRNAMLSSDLYQPVTWSPLN